MPAVSPALTRQLSMKVREDVVFEERAGNWRSVIHLQPIASPPPGSNDAFQSSEPSSSFASDIDSEECERLSPPDPRLSAQEPPLAQIEEIKEESETLASQNSDAKYSRGPKKSKSVAQGLEKSTFSEKLKALREGREEARAEVGGRKFVQETQRENKEEALADFELRQSP